MRDIFRKLFRPFISQPLVLDIHEIVMDFKNESISNEDCEKYDLRRIIGEQNPFQPGYMFVRDWTISREIDAFLAHIWTHRDADFDGYAFYWKGEWMFFKMRPVESKHDRADSTGWFRFQVKGFVVPDRLITQREALMGHLRAAITASSGGPTYNYARLSSTIDFIPA